MEFNLIVIRTDKIESIVKMYELIGFKFDYHRHGNGPFHYASEIDGFVFEIYPIANSDKECEKVRLGLAINNLKRNNAQNYKF